MKPQLTQFESKTTLNVVNIDLDQKSSPSYKKYIDKMTATGIPYTVIINPKGEVIYSAIGYKTSAELVTETKQFWK